MRKLYLPFLLCALWLAEPCKDTSYVTGGTTITASNSNTMTTAALQTGDVVVVGLGLEVNSATTFRASDNVNGSYSPIASTRGAVSGYL